MFPQLDIRVHHNLLSGWNRRVPCSAPVSIACEQQEHDDDGSADAERDLRVLSHHATNVSADCPMMRTLGRPNSNATIM